MRITSTRYFSLNPLSQCTCSNTGPGVPSGTRTWFQWRFFPSGHGFFHLQALQPGRGCLTDIGIWIFFGDLLQQFDVFNSLHRLFAYLGIGILPTRNKYIGKFHHGLLKFKDGSGSPLTHRFVSHRPTPAAGYPARRRDDALPSSRPPKGSTPFRGPDRHILRILFITDFLRCLSVNGDRERSQRGGNLHALARCIHRWVAK